MCLDMCLHSNFWKKTWLLTWSFDTLVHLDTIEVKLGGQGHTCRSKFKVTGWNKTATSLASKVRSICTVNVYIRGVIWRMTLNYDRNMLWLNVVLCWSMRLQVRTRLLSSLAAINSSWRLQGIILNIQACTMSCFCRLFFFQSNRSSAILDR